LKGSNRINNTIPLKVRMALSAPMQVSDWSLITSFQHLHTEFFEVIRSGGSGVIVAIADTSDLTQLFCNYLRHVMHAAPNMTLIEGAILDDSRSDGWAWQFLVRSVSGGMGVADQPCGRQEFIEIISDLVLQNGPLVVLIDACVVDDLRKLEGELSALSRVLSNAKISHLFVACVQQPKNEKSLLAPTLGITRQSIPHLSLTELKGLLEQSLIAQKVEQTIKNQIVEEVFTAGVTTMNDALNRLHEVVYKESIFDHDVPAQADANAQISVKKDDAAKMRSKKPKVKEKTMGKQADDGATHLPSLRSLLNSDID
jgi:hypothetical protein